MHASSYSHYPSSAPAEVTVDSGRSCRVKEGRQFRECFRAVEKSVALFVFGNITAAHPARTPNSPAAPINRIPHIPWWRSRGHHSVSKGTDAPLPKLLDSFCVGDSSPRGHQLSLRHGFA